MSEELGIKRKQGEAFEADTKKAKTDDDAPTQKDSETSNPGSAPKSPASSGNNTEKARDNNPTLKPIFGSATTFGNVSRFGGYANKPSVFGSPVKASKSDETTSFGSAVGSSFGSSFGSFGAGSKFENALQNASKKKSFLDEPAEPDASKPDSKSPAPSTEQYKQVNLAEKEVKTGEEHEKPVFNYKAKLFVLDLAHIKEGWKERGVGPLHLNTSISTPSEARLVMRSQGLLRVILNYKVTAETKLIKGLEASLTPGKFLRFNSVLEGAPVQYLIKFANETIREELVDKIAQVQASIEADATSAAESEIAKETKAETTSENPEKEEEETKKSINHSENGEKADATSASS